MVWPPSTKGILLSQILRRSWDSGQAFPGALNLPEERKQRREGERLGNLALCPSSGRSATALLSVLLCEQGRPPHQPSDTAAE